MEERWVEEGRTEVGRGWKDYGGRRWEEVEGGRKADRVRTEGGGRGGRIHKEKYKF
jgi:hypothetical protein